jgi:hypothetical protein
MNWVLIIMLSSPGGDFIDKRVEFVPTEAECQVQLQQLPKLSPMGLQQHAICVTMDHWTGRQPMMNVALD